MTLLTTGNPKTMKGQGFGYLTAILHLAPARLSGYNVCPMATAGCSAACLNTAGRGGIFKPGETTNVIQKARIRKTKMFYENRDMFMIDLAKEITNFVKLAAKHGLTPAIRLNGTSDIRWETIPIEYTMKDGSIVSVRNLMTLFPDVQFYDYTKIVNRRNLPKNYHLTFSLAESNEPAAIAALKNGMNVAAVFHKVPKVYLGHPVIDGDKSDLRFLDDTGVIVGLKAKGKAKRDTSGFVK
jgi:hypothetical protein